MAAALRVACGLALVLVGGLFLRVPSEERTNSEMAAQEQATGMKSLAETNSFGVELHSNYHTTYKNKAENLARPRRFAALFACSIGVSCLLSGVVRQVRPRLMMAGWPALMSAIGLVIAVNFFAFYPTAVYVPPDRVIGASREELNRWVENSGLLNNRLVGVVFGVGIALLGGVWAAVGAKSIVGNQPIRKVK